MLLGLIAPSAYTVCCGNGLRGDWASAAHTSRRARISGATNRRTSLSNALLLIMPHCLSSCAGGEPPEPFRPTRSSAWIDTEYPACWPILLPPQRETLEDGWKSFCWRVLVRGRNRARPLKSQHNQSLHDRPRTSPQLPVI